MKPLLLYIVLLGSLHTVAQDSVKLTKHFRFNDGIYMSFNDFYNNTPTRQFKEYKIKAHPLNRYDAKQFELKDLASNKRVPTMDVFAIVIGGVPFINNDYGKERKIADFFIIVNRLTVVGNICFFVYDDYGTDFDLQGSGTRPYVITRRMMFRFNTGEITSFNLSDFKIWIADDERLFATINALSDRDAAAKMYKCLLIYNDRNPIFMKTKTLD